MSWVAGANSWTAGSEISTDQRSTHLLMIRLGNDNATPNVGAAEAKQWLRVTRAGRIAGTNTW